jgi:RNA polymerase sigma factor (sigma-70 family)
VPRDALDLICSYRRPGGIAVSPHEVEAIACASLAELNAATLTSLASTRRIRAVLAVVEILDAFDVITPNTLLPQLEGAWHDPIDHHGFEAVVNEGNRAGDASALSWSVIGFESQRHINLVWHQANKLERVYPDRDASDLLALGWIGLRTALRLYDPSLGFSFSTYACTRITGAIRDGVRAENPVPKRLGTFSRKVAAAEEALAHGLGRAPTLAEVAEHLGVHLDELKILPRLQSAASIDEMETIAGERGSSPSWLIDDSDPADTALSILRRDAVDAALATLHPDDAAAVRLLVMEGMRPAEAQEITGEAPRRLRLRRERALAALREQLLGWDDTTLGTGENNQ